VTVSLPPTIEVTNINQVKVDNKQYPVTSLAESADDTLSNKETP